MRLLSILVSAPTVMVAMITVWVLVDVEKWGNRKEAY